LQGFTRETAHEIRTPMNTVALGFQIIRKELLEYSLVHRESPNTPSLFIGAVDGSAPASMEFILQMVSEVKASADIAVDLVSDLLLYDRLEVGGLQLALTPLKLWTLVKENMALFNIQVSVEKPNYCYRYLDLRYTPILSGISYERHMFATLFFLHLR